VPVGENRNENPFDHRPLADDPLADLVQQSFYESALLGDLLFELRKFFGKHVPLLCSPESKTTVATVVNHLMDIVARLEVPCAQPPEK